MNARIGVVSADPDHLTMCRALGASRFQLFRKSLFRLRWDSPEAQQLLLKGRILFRHRYFLPFPAFFMPVIEPR